MHQIPLEIMRFTCGSLDVAVLDVFSIVVLSRNACGLGSDVPNPGCQVDSYH